MSKISPTLLLCNKCKTYNSNPRPHPKYQFCCFIQCDGDYCFNSWYICTKHSLRFSLRSTTRFNKHFCQCHVAPSHVDSENTSNVTEDSLQTWTESYVGVNHDLLNYNPHNESNCSILKRSHLEMEKTDSNISDLPYSYINNVSSKKFFDDELKCSGDGLRCLVARTFTQEDNTEKKASNEESGLHIDISILCNKLSENDQYLFSSILNRVTQNDIFKITRPPLNYADICKFYTKSKQSININIPSPKVIEVDFHSCVSLESIINHLLAFGVEFNLINSQNSISDQQLSISLTQTKEARKILEKVQTLPYNSDLYGEPLILYVIIWSDDFEPNHTRKNRNSIWLKTVSICPPPCLKASSLYTFPISLGRKGHKVMIMSMNTSTNNFPQCKK